MKTKLLALCLFTTSVTASTLSPIVDDKGNISYPENFRENMVHVGSLHVPEGGASGFHDVFIDKKAVAEFKKTGKFPEGSIIVKELRGAKTGDFTTGPGVAYPTEVIKQTFVMVKDSSDKFAGKNESWGKGWGWALFKGDNAKNVSTNYKNDCFSCHIPAEKTDWVYTNLYPYINE